MILHIGWPQTIYLILNFSGVIFQYFITFQKQKASLGKILLSVEMITIQSFMLFLLYWGGFFGS